MSPHRTSTITQLGTALALDTIPAVSAVGGGVLATLGAYLTGWHMLLFYGVVLVQMVDVWSGAERALMTNPPSFDKSVLRRGIGRKVYRIGCAVLFGPAVDLAARAVGGFFDAGLLASAGASGAASMTALACLFTAEAHSAATNMRATNPDIPLGPMMAGVRGIDVVVGQAAGALSPDGTVHARRGGDVLLRDLQEAGAAPLVPGEGLVPLDDEVLNPQHQQEDPT